SGSKLASWPWRKVSSACRCGRSRPKSSAAAGGCTVAVRRSGVVTTKRVSGEWRHGPAANHDGFSTGAAWLCSLAGLSMKQDNPLTQAAVIAAVVIVFLLWLADLREQRAGTPNPRAFPGAQPVATRAVLIA